MAIMDFFKPVTSTTPTQSTQAAQPEQTSTGLSDHSAPIAKEVTPENPLDVYRKMFDTAATTGEVQAPSFKLDPKVLSDVSQGMDFTAKVDPALMEQALAGDSKALIAVIQAAGRTAYSASLEHATALTEAHLGQRSAYESSRVDKGVKQQLTSDALSTAPNYSHPVVRQELNRVASQYAAANPDASPKDVAEAAQKYIADLSQALSKSPVAAEGTNMEMDWAKYLSN